MAGTELNISAEDLDFSNKADERLSCDYQGDDMHIGFNSRFLSEMLNNLNSNEVLIEMSLPNRAGILTPIDGTDEGEQVTMLGHASNVEQLIGSRIFDFRILLSKQIINQTDIKPQPKSCGFLITFNT